MARLIRFCSVDDYLPFRAICRDEEYGARCPGDPAGYITMNSNETRKMGGLRHRKPKVGGLLHHLSFSVLTLRAMVI